MEVPLTQENPASGADPSRGDRVASAGTVGMLVLLALGGAARDGGSAALGVPPDSAVALGCLAGALAWASGVTGLRAFVLPAGALLVGSFLLPATAPLLLFSGPPLLAFAFAGLVLGVASSSWRPPKWLLAPFFFALYAGVSYQVQTRVGPDGDEPQYLMVSESLVRDHDLVLDQDFKEQRYRAFFSRPLEPDFRIRGPQGQIYSLHAVGLSILILPAYWAFGYPGASFFMALLAALLVREVRRMATEVTGDGKLAEGTAWLIGLSPPVIHFAGLIFTEIPAALLLCVGLRAAVFGRGLGPALLSAACASALPWLNVRYAILAVAVGGALAWRLFEEVRPDADLGRVARRLLPPALVLAGSAVAISLYHHSLWGFFDPRRVYGRRREFSLDILPEGLPGLFFDQEFGLFVYAPIFVLSLAGFVQLFKRRKSLALAALFAAVGVIATASVWPMWRGGFNPPARFLVPLVSVLAAGLALALQRGLRPATALLAGWSLWCGLGGALNIETVHRDRDGVAPFFRTQSGAREWTAALPSFVLQEDRATRSLAWPWAALLSLPLLGAISGPKKQRVPPRRRGALLATLAFMSTAVIADRMSPRARSPERDSTRLLGRASLVLPTLRLEADGRAGWEMDFFYEPHRAPLGVRFAQAIPLSPGRYELTLESSDLMGGAAPDLILADHRTARGSPQAMKTAARSLSTTIVVGVASEYDLSLIGGEPVSLRRGDLRRVPGG
ncbi:MAG: hypothetical protein K1Y01_21770 [Vicinamibacteria bacterium]|nr:hypothetical protein [Vicinamibacteria bacterium]